MAVSLLLSTLSSLHERKELQVGSPRALIILQYRDEMIAVMKREGNEDHFAKFAVTLLGE